MSIDENNQGRSYRLTAFSITALIIVLIGYPLFRMAVAYLDVFPASGTRDVWWSLWSVIFIGHWVCAGIVAIAIASEKGGWASIGLNWKTFIRTRLVLIIVIAVAIVAAVVAPGYYYESGAPDQMRSHPFGPVTAVQRVFWIGMAVTAGIVEEVVYRGYVITRIRRLAGWPLALLASTLAFTFMHGPSAFIPDFFLLYVASGVLFAAAFLGLGMRRLEILILIHIILDLSLVFAP